MQGNIIQKIDYISEAFSLLGLLASDEGVAELERSLGKKYDLSGARLREIFDLLGQIEQEAHRRMDDSREDIEYYFYEKDGETEALAGFVLLGECWHGFIGDSTEDIKKSLASMTEEEYCRLFGERLFLYGSRILDSSGIERDRTPGDVMRRILRMKLADAEKLRLQEVFWEPERHRKCVFGLLERAAGVLRHFEAELTREAEQFYDYWKGYEESQNLRSFLTEKLGISIGENPYGYEVYPAFISANAAGFFCDVSDNGEFHRADVYRLGILFSAGIPLGTGSGRKGAAMEGHALDVLKLLSDRSKFEILSYIRDKSAYGSELAKHLDLTTATISHHMGGLLGKGLVELEKENNRIFYRANTEEIAEVLSWCQRVLTGK